MSRGEGQIRCSERWKGGKIVPSRAESRPRSLAVFVHGVWRRGRWQQGSDPCGNTIRERGIGFLDVFRWKSQKKSQRSGGRAPWVCCLSVKGLGVTHAWPLIRAWSS